MFKVSDEGAFVEVSLVSPIPAISLKLDHQNLKVRNKIKKILGIDVPSVQSVIKYRHLSLCWISNDELLLLKLDKTNYKVERLITLLTNKINKVV